MQVEVSFYIQPYALLIGGNIQGISYEIVIKFEYSFVRVWLYNFSVLLDLSAESEGSPYENTYNNFNCVRVNRPFYGGNRLFSTS